MLPFNVRLSKDSRDGHYRSLNHVLLLLGVIAENPSLYENVPRCWFPVPEFFPQSLKRKEPEGNDRLLAETLCHTTRFEVGLLKSTFHNVESFIILYSGKRS